MPCARNASNSATFCVPGTPNTHSTSTSLSASQSEANPSLIRPPARVLDRAPHDSAGCGAHVSDNCLRARAHAESRRLGTLELEPWLESTAQLALEVRHG